MIRMSKIMFSGTRALKSLFKQNYYQVQAFYHPNQFNQTINPAPKSEPKSPKEIERHFVHIFTEVSDSFRKGRYTEAITKADSYLKYSEDKPKRSPHYTSAILIQKSLALLASGDSSNALESLKLAEGLIEDIKPKELNLLGMVKEAYAQIYMANEDYLRAREYLEDALKVFMENGMPEIEARSRVFLALAECIRHIEGDEPALNWLKNCIREIPVKLLTVSELMKTYERMGHISQTLGKDQEALEYYDKALSLAGEDSYFSALIFHGKGKVYMFQKDYKKAEEAFVKAAALCTKYYLKNSQYTATVYRDLCLLYETIEKWEHFVEVARKIVQILSYYPKDDANMYPTLKVLSKGFLKLEKYNEVWPLLESMMDIAKKNGYAEEISQIKQIQEDILKKEAGPAR